MSKREIIALTPETKIGLTKLKGELMQEQGKIFSYETTVKYLLELCNQVRCTEKVGEKREGSKEV